MKPGEIIPSDQPVVLNAEAEPITIKVANTGDRTRAGWQSLPLL